MIVETLTGKTITLKVRDSDTIRDVKTKIQAEEGIHPNQQILVFNGDQLKDEHRLADYKIESQSIFHLLSTGGDCNNCIYYIW